MNQIDQIKEILFSNEKRALDALTRRIEGRESRVADIADVLPEALGRSHANGEKINKALQRPVEEILKDSVQRDPQGFANLLFPVMGPAIRKSITETLKQFTESINRAIEEKTSLKSFKWRREARKAGIPYGQYLLQRNLEYRVDHAYLIEPNTGLLIADAHRPEAIRRDDEAVSAMLTAIQDFVRESFTTENKSSLETADIGEYSLWVMQGPEAMLACVIFGIPPRTLREDFTEILESIHLQYGQQLQGFEGQQLSIIEPVLEDCLFSQAKQTENTEDVKQKKFGFMHLLGLGLLALGIWFAFQRFQFNHGAGAFIEKLESENGIVLTETELSGGKLAVAGLRDPAAIEPETALLNSGLDVAKVSLKFTPFHSLEPEIIEQRVKAKIEIPADVSMNFNASGELVFAGKVTADFKQQATRELENLLGVRGLKFDDIYYSDESLLAEVVKRVQAPESVDLAVKEQILVARGTAPLAFHKRLESLAPKVEGLSGLSIAELSVAEIDQAKQLFAELNEHTFKFTWRTKLDDAAEAELESYADKLKQFGPLLVSLERAPEIILTGYTDDSGSVNMNQDLQLERALYIKGRLVGLGVKPDWLFVKGGQNQDQISHSGSTNIEMRKVIVVINNQL